MTNYTSYKKLKIEFKDVFESRKVEAVWQVNKTPKWFHYELDTNDHEQLTNLNYEDIFND